MDLITLAIPGFFASMGYEAWWLKQRAGREGPSPVDYETKDTLASLTMGLGSLVVPLATKKLSNNLAAPSGKWVRRAVAIATASAAAATAADAYRRRNDREAGSVEPLIDLRLAADSARASSPGVVAEASTNCSTVARFAGGAAATAIVAGGVVATSTWAARTTATRLFERRILPDLGTGAAAIAAGIAGWDFIYYWNHRFMHQSRFLWAVHVVHHSSERYNLSTALRQPVADSLGIFVPYGVLALLGVRPEAIETGRQVNLIYQYWIHTDAIRRIGVLEEVLNTASHHRVHHGMDRKYLDRNHGSILIIWDRLFGTFQREEEQPTYGLTKNINTFNPLRIAGHEHAQIIRDVAAADNWRDRLSYVLRRPGWTPVRGRRPVRAAVSSAISLLRR